MYNLIIMKSYNVSHWITSIEEQKEILFRKIKSINEAKEYFVKKEKETIHQEWLKLEEINTGYIRVLEDCVTFIEQTIENPSSEESYGNITWRSWLLSTLWIAKHLVNFFFDPKTNDRLRATKTSIITRDYLEQWYRICLYVSDLLKEEMNNLTTKPREKTAQQIKTKEEIKHTLHN